MAKTTQSTERVAQVAAGGSYATTGGTNGDFTSRIDDSRKVEAPMQLAIFNVPITADNVATDVIDVWEFPLGTIIYPQLCWIIVTDDMTSGAMTIDVGDGVDPDRYADGLNAASVTNPGVNFLTPAFPDGFTNPHEMIATTKLLKVTLATFAATIEAGSFQLVIAYKLLAP